MCPQKDYITDRGIIQHYLVRDLLSKTDIKGLKRVVLKELFLRADNNTLSCNPSVSRISEDCGFCIKSTREALISLEQDGVISITRRKSATGNMPSTYRINMSALLKRVGTHSKRVGTHSKRVGTHSKRVGTHSKRVGVLTLSETNSTNITLQYNSIPLLTPVSDTDIPVRVSAEREIIDSADKPVSESVDQLNATACDIMLNDERKHEEEIEQQRIAEPNPGTQGESPDIKQMNGGCEMSSKKSDPKAITPAQMERAFEAFYNEYPRKVGRGRAFRVFDAMVRRSKEPNKLVNQLILCAKHYNAVRNYEREQRNISMADMLQYTLHPSTFLGRDEHWKDYIEVPTVEVDEFVPVDDWG